MHTGNRSRLSAWWDITDEVIQLQRFDLASRWRESLVSRRLRRRTRRRRRALRWLLAKVMQIAGRPLVVVSKFRHRFRLGQWAAALVKNVRVWPYVDAQYRPHGVIHMNDTGGLRPGRTKSHQNENPVRTNAHYYYYYYLPSVSGIPRGLEKN